MRDLTTGSEARLILSFSIPLLLGNVFQQLYSTIDAIVVGIGINDAALAAIGVSFPIIFLMISLISGIGMGAGIVISQYFGAKDHARLRISMHTGYLFLFLVSIGVTILGLVISEPVLRLINTPAEYFDQALVFLRITFIGMVFVFGYNAISSVLRSAGDSKNPLYFLIISTVLNIGLDLLFVLVFKWGIEGAAWATVISQGVAFFVSLWYVQKSKHQLFKISWSELKIDRRELGIMLKMGLPSAAQMGLVSLSFIALSAIINPFGQDAMAGYTAASRLDSFAVLPAMTLSMAISTFVGQNMGAGKPERVKRGLVATLLIAGVISVLSTLIFWVFGRQLVAAFVDSVAAIEIGTQYLIIVSSFYLLFSTMFVITGLIRGAGAASFSMLATVVAVWVARIPAAYLLSQVGGIQGIWWGLPIGWAFALAMVLVYYFRGTWKNKAIIRRPAAAATAVAADVPGASSGSGSGSGSGAPVGGPAVPPAAAPTAPQAE